MTEIDYALENFIATQKRLNRSPHTIVNYQSDLKKFFQWCHLLALHPHRISSKLMSDYLEFLAKGGLLKQRLGFFQRIFHALRPWELKTLQQRPLKVASQRRHFSALRQYYDYLMITQTKRWPWSLKANPIKNLLHTIQLKDQDITPTKTMKREVFEHLNEKATKVRDRLALALLFYGGLRLQEVVKIRVDQIHFASQSLKIVRKGGRLHTLRPQNFPELERLILIHLQRRPKASEWLFAGRDPKSSLSSRAMAMRIQKLLQKGADEKGLTPHSFRKGRATYLYQQTRDLLFVRDYLNHRDAKVTQTYIDTQLLWENESFEESRKAESPELHP